MISFYHCLQISYIAEGTHGAYTAAAHAIYDYVDDTDRWPTTWEQLAPYLPPLWRTPEAIAGIKERVRVDFTATLQEIAAIDVNHFEAVMPIGPSYGASMSPALIALAKRKVANRRKATPAAPRDLSR